MAYAQQGPSWKQKVYEADKIAQEVFSQLESHNLELPETPRMPDMRLIVKAMEKDVTFMNPGKHSDMPEHIPFTGEKTAAMIMLQGDTLRDQQAAAEELVRRYNLMEEGLTQEFIADMPKLVEEGLLKEAYGPAPFETVYAENGEVKENGQVERLEAINWEQASGPSVHLEPEKGYAAAYGTRAIGTEKVFKLDVPLYVQGSNTTPELLNGDICIAVDEDRKTGEMQTRPIAPDAARTIYGNHFDDIPVVTMHPDAENLVEKIDLKKNEHGDVIEIAPPEEYNYNAVVTPPSAAPEAPDQPH